MKTVEKILKKVFNAGKRCAMVHPDDSSYDKVHFDRVIKKVELPSLTDELKNDPDLRRAYHDNIAMAYKDSYHWYSQKNKKRVMNKEDLHKIANKSAEYFLNLLLQN